MSFAPDSENLLREADPELYALEKMVAARCEQIWQLIEDGFAPGDDRSREVDLQIQAFAERHSQAVELLETGRREAREIRVPRLEALLEALHCSRDFFATLEPEQPLAQASDKKSPWRSASSISSR